MRAGSSGVCWLEIEFVLKPGKRREFARSFEDLICQEGEGHIKSAVFEDRDEPGHMIWVATWSSRAAVEAYMQSDQFGVVIGGLRVLSSRTDCRLIDEVHAAVATGAIPARRTPQESRFTPIDLSDLEGPKH